MLAIAALVVNIVALTRPSVPAEPIVSASTSTPTLTSTPETPSDTTEADRALCTAIAPLMTESNQAAKTYFGLGEPGTPARDVATPKYVSDTKDWARRVQSIVDEHPGVDPFFLRSLQRTVDDIWLFALDIGSGPLARYDITIYEDHLIAYTGPIQICQRLGVRW